MAVTQNKIVFTQSMKHAAAICTAAKTTYNDATNAVLLLTAGADGSLVKGLSAMPRATVAATQLQLYLSRDGGTTLELIDSVVMPVFSMVQTAAVPKTKFIDISPASPLILAGGGTPHRLYVAIGVALAGGIVFDAPYEDF